MTRASEVLKKIDEAGKPVSFSMTYTNYLETYGIAQQGAVGRYFADDKSRVAYLLSELVDGTPKLSRRFLLITSKTLKIGQDLVIPTKWGSDTKSVRVTEICKASKATNSFDDSWYKGGVNSNGIPEVPVIEDADKLLSTFTTEYNNKVDPKGVWVFSSENLRFGKLPTLHFKDAKSQVVSKIVFRDGEFKADCTDYYGNVFEEETFNSFEDAVSWINDKGESGKLTPKDYKAFTDFTKV